MKSFNILNIGHVNTFWGYGKEPYFGPFNSIEPMTMEEIAQLDKYNEAAYYHDLEYTQAKSMDDIYKADRTFLERLPGGSWKDVIANIVFKYIPIGNVYGAYNVYMNDMLP